MNDHGTTLLKAGELSIVAAERRRQAPEAARERVLARLAGAIPVLTAPPPRELPAPLRVPGVRHVLALKFFAVFAVGVAVGAGALALVRTDPTGRIVFVEAPPAPAPPPSAVASNEAVPPVVDRAEPTPRPSSVSSAATTRLPSPPASNLERASSLSEERALLDLARQAIMRGEPAQALAPLEAHRTRFPRGMLVEEREALTIRALARTGKGEEVRVRGEAFRARYPQSLLLDGVEGDLRQNP